MTSKLKIVVAGILLLSMTCCGYRFTGGGTFPFGIKKIFVPMFTNRTAETGLENIFTNDFIYEFTRSSMVDVVEKNMADAPFTGTIRSLSTDTVSRSGIQSPLERRVKVTLDLKLSDKQGKVLWSTRGISDDETYEVFEEKLSTERQQTNALKKLSRRMAEMVYNLITDLE